MLKAKDYGIWSIIETISKSAKVINGQTVTFAAAQNKNVWEWAVYIYNAPVKLPDVNVEVSDLILAADDSDAVNITFAVVK